ncbi:MAG: hypothetical protein ABIK65_12840 [Candidatus Eisenbacteria bacterium]
MGRLGNPVRSERPPLRSPPAALVLLALCAVPALVSGADDDGNGIDDQAELLLAKRFRPTLVFPEGESSSMKPVPVRILGGENGLTADRLWARVYNGAGRFVGVFRTTDGGWSPPPSFGHAEFNYSGFGWDHDAIPYVGAPPGAAYSIYYVRLHPDYGGPGIDCPEGWADLFERGSADHPAAGDLPAAAYVHLFLEDGFPVIQYWFFLPYNDWVNNHEGDWEHLHVQVTSADPGEAELRRACFYFHGYHLECDPPSLLIADGRHPVVWMGGSSPWRCGFCDESDCGEDETDHPGSHAVYPAPGLWNGVGAEVPGCGRAGEEVPPRGRRVDWQELEVILLPEPESVDYSSEPGLSWHRAFLPFGTPYVPTYCDDGCEFLGDFPVTGWLIGECGNRAPPGPAHHDSWGLFSGGTVEGAYTGPIPGVGPLSLRVPASYPTLAAAAAAALPGDTILVAPGTYEASILLPGGITLRSESGAEETFWLAPPLGRALRVRPGGAGSRVGDDGAGFTFDREPSSLYPIEFLALPEEGECVVRGNTFLPFALARAVRIPAGSGSVRVESNRFGPQVRGVEIELTPGRTVAIGGGLDRANDFVWTPQGEGLRVEADSCGPCSPVDGSFNYWGTVTAEEVAAFIAADPGRALFEPWTDSTHTHTFGATGLEEPAAGGGAPLLALSVAPHPSTGAFDLRLALARPARVRVRLADLRGRIVLGPATFDIQEGSRTVRLGKGTLGSGVYFLIVECGGAREVRRVTNIR